MFLNWLKLAIFLKSSGRSFHKTAAVYLKELRFIYEDYNSTYEELLHIAKVPSLQIRIMRTMALECIKIL
jgi:hypothetical protein